MLFIILCNLLCIKAQYSCVKPTTFQSTANKLINLQHSKQPTQQFTDKFTNYLLYRPKAVECRLCGIMMDKATVF